MRASRPARRKSKKSFSRRRELPNMLSGHGGDRSSDSLFDLLNPRSDHQTTLLASKLRRDGPISESPGDISLFLEKAPSRIAGSPVQGAGDRITNCDNPAGMAPSVGGFIPRPDCYPRSGSSPCSADFLRVLHYQVADSVAATSPNGNRMV